MFQIASANRYQILHSHTHLIKNILLFTLSISCNPFHYARILTDPDRQGESIERWEEVADGINEVRVVLVFGLCNNALYNLC